MKKWYAFLLIGMILSGCVRTGCCSGKVKIPDCLCFDGRRAQVIEKTADCVIESWCEDQTHLFQKSPLEEEEEEGPPPPYRLAIGDVIEISVYGEEDSRQESVQVAPDGKIYYSILEGVQAAGRGVKEVADDLSSHLQSLYIHPAVTVVPRIAYNQNVKILGRVQEPGVYPVVGRVTIRDVIGEAGGIYRQTNNNGDRNSFSNSSLYPLADLKASFIVRDQRRLPVNFEKILYSSGDANNIEVKPGDYIYIASSGIQEVYVLGAVRAQQRLEYTQGMTLVGALASSSGWLSGGPFGGVADKVLILRGPLRCPCPFEINVKQIVAGEDVDILLQPGDIIYVPDKTMRFGRALVRIAVNAFIQSFVSGGSSYYGQIWVP